MKTTGTATDYHDLLDKLRAWLVGTVGWTQLRWTAPSLITDTAELWVQGPGAGAGREVTLGFQSAHNSSLGAYGWRVCGAISFDNTQAFNLQDGLSPGSYFNTWQNTIDYWFYANDRRVIVVAKVSTVYQSLYAGFMLPFTLPSEYAFPLYIGTSYPTLAAYNLSEARNRFIADPGDGAAYYRKRTGASWQRIVNQYNSSSPYDPSIDATTGILWPMRQPRASVGYGHSDWNGENFNLLRPTQGGEGPLWQCTIIDAGNSIVVGGLDGVFVTPGFNRSTEQLVSQSGRSFRLFQNVFRNNGRDFMGIEEI